MTWLAKGGWQEDVPFGQEHKVTWVSVGLGQALPLMQCWRVHEVFAVLLPFPSH